jgi:hypothetical protein
MKSTLGCVCFYVAIPLLPINHFCLPSGTGNGIMVVNFYCSSRLFCCWEKSGKRSKMKQIWLFPKSFQHTVYLTDLLWTNHRNLRTRRRMHLCMQDNQIGLKFMGFAPADMARLPHLINTKNSFSSPSAGTTPTLNLPCFTRENVHLD